MTPDRVGLINELTAALHCHHNDLIGRPYSTTPAENKWHGGQSVGRFAYERPLRHNPRVPVTRNHAQRGRRTYGVPEALLNRFPSLIESIIIFLLSREPGSGHRSCARLRPALANLPSSG